MKKTENYGLSLYEKEDKMNITAEENSLNANMKIIDNALKEKANVNDMPTKVSELENDSGFINKVIETDPTVPDYVKDIKESDIENWNNKSEFSGDYNDLTNKPVIPTVPTKVSQLENDKNYITSIPSEYVTETELSEKGYATESFVANKIAEAELSGSDVDLSGLATKDELASKVDKVKGKSLIDDTEIERLANVTNYDDTELKNQINSKADKTDIPTVPTNISSFTNDKGYITEVPSEYVTETELNAKGYITEHQNISHLATKDEVNKKADVSHTHSEYLTEIPSEYVTDSELNAKGYLTQHQDLSNYAKKTEIPTKVSELSNDKNYLTSIPSEYVTDTELNAKGYLTEHQDLSAYAKTSDIPTKVSELSNDKNYLTAIPSEYITETELNAKGYLTEHQDISNLATKSELNNKVDKVSGKSLVDDTEIARLKNVTNYDDTELKNQVNSKASITDMVNYIEENKTVLLIGEENPLRGKSIACIGDSIMESRTDNTSAAYNGGGWPKIIGERNNMMVNNIGKSGSTLSNYYSDSNGTPTFSAVRTINAQIDAITESDYIIFDGCINDWSQNKKIGVITEGYGDTFDKETILGGLEYICYVLNTTYHTKKYGYIFNHRMVLDTNSKTNIGTWIEFRNKIKEVLEKWAIPYLDLEVMIPSLMYLTSLKSLYTGNNGDGIHPNEEGYRIFYCDKIEAWLRTLGISSTEKEPVINYTNLVHTSIDSDGAIYNSVGYQNGLYLSEGNTTSSNLPCVTTGFIPANGGDVVRIAGVLWEDITYNNNTLYAYDSNFTCLGGVSSRSQRKTPATAGNEIHSSVDVSGNMGVVTLKTIDTIAYIRVASMGDGDTSKTIDGSKMIVTINEEII